MKLDIPMKYKKFEPIHTGGWEVRFTPPQQIIWYDDDDWWEEFVVNEHIGEYARAVVNYTDEEMENRGI